PGPGRDLVRNPRGVEVEGLRIHVDKDRSGPNVNDHVRRGGEGHGAGDDFIPLADAERQEGEVEGSRAGGDSHGMTTPDVRAERRLEALGPRPRREPARGEGISDLSDFLGTDQWLVEREGLLSNRRAAE